MNIGKKNILIISSPPINNAAGIIAYDLHKALAVNHNSEIITRWSSIKEKGVIPYYSNFNKLINRVKNKINSISNLQINTNKDYHFRDINQNKNLINVKKLKKIIQPPNIIIAYFMGNLFTLKDLHQLQKIYNAQVILIMADMVYITGGCHYAWDCEGYKYSCLNCPAIIEKKNKHYASDNLKLNKKLIEEMDISLVALSSQDSEYAKQSTLFKNVNINFILGGINLDVFHLKNNRKELRKKYNINTHDFVILFGATSIGEKRKGVKYFIEAINHLEKKIKVNNITIVSIGNGNLSNLLTKTKFNIVNLGYLDDYEELSNVFNVADTFVTTTIQDSGPMMVNQSIACGTPVVCFNIGVARDIVINGKTGYKVDLGNSEEIANSILSLYSKETNEKHIISENCFSLAQKNYSKEVSAENILKLCTKS